MGGKRRGVDLERVGKVNIYMIKTVYKILKELMKYFFNWSWQKNQHFSEYEPLL